MRINELEPGMLLKPQDGHVWVEVPWRGSDGTVVGHYIKVMSSRYQPAENEEIRNENVLYLGDTTRETLPTPGRQIVLAWGRKMTVEPGSWRLIASIT